MSEQQCCCACYDILHAVNKLKSFLRSSYNFFALPLLQVDLFKGHSICCVWGCLWCNIMVLAVVTKALPSFLRGDANQFCSSLASLCSVDSTTLPSRCLCCSQGSLSLCSVDSATLLSYLCCGLCRSLGSLSLVHSAALLSRLFCSLTSLESTSSATTSRLCCRHAFLCSSVWTARLVLLLTRRLANLSSLSSKGHYARVSIFDSPRRVASLSV